MTCYFWVFLSDVGKNRCENGHLHWLLQSAGQRRREGLNFVSSDLLHTGFLRRDCTDNSSLTDKSYCTEASPMTQEGTESYQGSGSGIQKSHCAQVAWEKRTKTWVGAWSHSNTGQACTLRGKGRVWLFFSHWIQFGEGSKICSCGQALKNFTCLPSAMHSYAALSVTANLSSERNMSLKDSCSNLFFLLNFFSWRIFVY